MFWDFFPLWENLVSFIFLSGCCNRTKMLSRRNTGVMFLPDFFHYSKSSENFQTCRENKGYLQLLPFVGAGTLGKFTFKCLNTLKGNWQFSCIRISACACKLLDKSSIFCFIQNIDESYVFPPYMPKAISASITQQNNLKPQKEF